MMDLIIWQEVNEGTILANKHCLYITGIPLTTYASYRCIQHGMTVLIIMKSTDHEPLIKLGVCTNQ